MDLVAALMTIANEKKASLENLDYLLKEKCIDQTTCNSLIEQVNIDFERKKKDLMEPAVQTLQTVITVSTPTPVSATIANNVVTVLDDDDECSSVTPKRIVSNDIGSFFKTVSICNGKSNPEATPIRCDFNCTYCPKTLQSIQAKRSHEKSCKSKKIAPPASQSVCSIFFGQETAVRVVSKSSSTELTLMKDHDVVRLVMESLLNKVIRKVNDDNVKIKISTHRRPVVGQGLKLTTGAIHRTRYELEFKANIVYNDSMVTMVLPLDEKRQSKKRAATSDNNVDESMSNAHKSAPKKKAPKSAVPKDNASSKAVPKSNAWVNAASKGKKKETVASIRKKKKLNLNEISRRTGKLKNKMQPL